MVEEHNNNNNNLFIQRYIILQMFLALNNFVKVHKVIRVKNKKEAKIPLNINICVVKHSAIRLNIRIAV